MKKKHVISDIIKIVLVLAVVEYAVMVLLGTLGQWDYIWMSILLDASILTVVSTTILYYWLIKPTIKQQFKDAKSGSLSPKDSMLQLSTLILISGLIIFVVEVIVMVIMISSVDLAGGAGEIIDALAVSLVSAPLLYIWAIKPLYLDSRKFLKLNTTTKLQQIVKRFILYFLPSLMIFILAVISTQRITISDNMERLEASETLIIQKQKDIVVNALNNIFSDLTFLSNQQDLSRIKDSISVTGRRFLGIDFQVFMEHKLIYDQIRYIDPQGMEVVRANFNNGQPQVVPRENLQSKKQRYYYTETVGWNKNEVFISPLDLNIEFGEIERPFKPMLRFGSPVVNDAGQNRGIVIINYYAQTLLDKLTASTADKQSEFMLLNSEGYWLIGPDPEVEWAFMFEDKLDLKFGNTHTKAWEEMSESNSGQIITDGGLYTYQTFHPAELLFESGIHSIGSSEGFLEHINSKDLAWKLVSYIPAATLHQISSASVRQLQPFYILIFIFLMAGSWTMAYIVSARKLSQEALIASERNYRKIIDESMSTIFTTTATGELTYVNPSAEGLTGYTSKELFKKTFPELIREDWRSKVQQFYYEQLQERKPETALEFPIITKSGQEKWVEQLATLLIDDDEQVSGFQSIVYDVTERKKAEQKLFIAKQMAEEASQLKSEFLANMSHELRTPLNSVIGFSNVLFKKNEKTMDEKDKNYLQRILSNGEHLLELINDVLDLSKIEAGRIELELVDISLVDLVKDIVAQVEVQAQDKQFDLITDIPETMAPIQTDPGKLKQVVLNLLSNAMKFTEEGAVTVTIETDATTNQPILISVRDTGIGIPEHRLESVFDEFQQVDASTTRKYGGTGLGLTISKSLCELMGYNLTVDSKEGEGSVFTIHLNGPSMAEAPRSARFEEKRKKDRGGSNAAIATSIRGRRILIIDDNRDARTLMEQTLKEEGCKILQAEDGFQGFDIALEQQPDLIILDLKMKATSGQEVLARLKANSKTRNIPVIIASIVALESKESLGAAADFVQKPIKAEALVWAVIRQIGSKP